MRMIFRIARKELELLFYSPMAWLLLLCFLVQTGIMFSGIYSHLLLNVEQYGRTTMASNLVFFGERGMWFTIVNMLSLYIPLLTMGIVGKEFTSGSIKLLYSSPVKNSQIILGKYVALVVFAFILVGTSLIHVIYAWCTIEGFEWGWVLTGWLGVFLLVCTYMAVGLFISSLASYQLVAALCTFLVLAGLGMIGNVGQHYDWIREITHWLGISKRVYPFIAGILCSEDLIYFPVISAMFLTFAIIRLHAVRQHLSFYSTALKNLGVVCVVCLVAIVTSQPMFKWYKDTTKTQRNTLLPVSQDIVKQLDGGLSITAYVNVIAPFYGDIRYPGFILEQRDIFEQYTRFKPEIKLNTVYYYAELEEERKRGAYDKKSAWELAKEVCARDGLDSTKLLDKVGIDKIVDLSGEDYRIVWQIKRENGDAEWLRYFYYGGSRIPREGEITMALKRLVKDMPKIAFVTGQAERSIMDESVIGYSSVGNDKKSRVSLWNQGFDIEEVTLEQPIREDISLLVMAEPRRELTLIEQQNLKSYIDRGGDMLLLVEPEYKEATNPWTRELLGIEVTPLVVQDRVIEPQILVATTTESAQNVLYRLSKAICIPGGGGIEVVEKKGFEVFPIAICEGWTELETVDFVDDTVRFNPEIGEINKQFDVILGLHRKIENKEQRIVIVGDADCISNNENKIRRNNGTYNGGLIISLCNWLSDGEAPINVNRPVSPEQNVNVTEKSYQFMKVLFVYILPLLVLGMYVFLWLRRRCR